MLHELLENVRKTGPLVHNITNYVTVNDCANALLACGASPIMAEDRGEAAEITAICNGLHINIGTLTAATIPAMLDAGKRANELGRPVVLDPVGAGASRLRTETAARLLAEVRFSVIRGNASEIKALAGAVGSGGGAGSDGNSGGTKGTEGTGGTGAGNPVSPASAGGTKGVDANIADSITDETLAAALVFAKGFAAKTGSVVVITGAIDIVTDGRRAFCIRNGQPMMSRVTGTGCMLSALTTAYVAANPRQPLEAAAAAVCVMGLCGERAFARLGARDGNAAYRNYIIDELYHLSGEELEAGAKYDMG
jgi:hydroxyethylthiazole kinase